MFMYQRKHTSILLKKKKVHKTKRAEDQNIIRISMQQSYTKLFKRSQKYVMEK